MPALGDASPASEKAAAEALLARLGAVGRPLAVGAVALAADAAAIWLARRAGREAPGPPPASRPAGPRPAGLEPEGYYEEVLLVVTRGGTRPGRLLARRSGVFGRYTGGR